jgi:hypothetical protein
MRYEKSSFNLKGSTYYCFKIERTFIYFYLDITGQGIICRNAHAYRR